MKKEVRCHLHSSLVQLFVGGYRHLESILIHFAYNKIKYVCQMLRFPRLSCIFNMVIQRKCIFIKPHKLVSQRKQTKFNDSNVQTQGPLKYGALPLRTHPSLQDLRLLDFTGKELFSIMREPPLEICIVSWNIVISTIY